MNTDKDNVDIFAQEITLPDHARQTLNHCNLPTTLLGSLAFQNHPTTLRLDGVHEHHARLFDALDQMDSAQQRAQRFMDYMVVQFRLHRLEDAGLETHKLDQRQRADYLRVLRGWLFNPDGREAAVLKSWVESRFGLRPRYHRGPLDEDEGSHYPAYLSARAKGLLGTNALEAQLDLLYSYCQYELNRRYPGEKKLTLYRGVNRLECFDVLKRIDRQHAVILLNNLNSFTADHERADEFGDRLLQVEVPWQKVFYYATLLPGPLRGENEFLVIGGLYRVRLGL